MEDVCSRRGRNSARTVIRTHSHAAKPTLTVNTIDGTHVYFRTHRYALQVERPKGRSNERKKEKKEKKIQSAP